jgi:hypothetical protein
MLKWPTRQCNHPHPPPLTKQLLKTRRRRMRTMRVTRTLTRKIFKMKMNVLTVRTNQIILHHHQQHRALKGMVARKNLLKSPIYLRNKTRPHELCNRHQSPSPSPFLSPQHRVLRNRFKSCLKSLDRWHTQRTASNQAPGQSANLTRIHSPTL